MKLSKVLFAVSLTLFSSFVFAQQSTTGPVPPKHVKAPVNDLRQADEQKVLTDVPAYIWRHGCGPTAVGMVIGYYDRKGYSFIDGDASSQLFNPAINQAIATGGDSDDDVWSDNPQHYEDYSRPRDDNSSSVIADKSESDDAHTANCIADFMETSWSSKGNFYGWSYGSKIPASFNYFVEMAQPGVNPSTGFYWKSSLTFLHLKIEINADRPMVFLVDTDGNGSTDHFVTVVGYRTVDDQEQYGCLDTWYNTVRWCDFKVIASGVSWGYYGGWAFSLDDIPAPETSALDACSLYR